MKAVITRQKYKCDFCKKRGIKTAMEKHERRCFRNPNRYCDYCENKGYTNEEENDGEVRWQEPCVYCSKRDLAKEKEIAEYEATIAPQNSTSKEEINTPF